MHESQQGPTRVNEQTPVQPGPVNDLGPVGSGGLWLLDATALPWVDLGSRVAETRALQRSAGNRAVARALLIAQRDVTAVDSEADGDVGGVSLPDITCTTHANYQAPVFDLAGITYIPVKGKDGTWRASGRIAVTYKVDVTIDPVSPPDGLSTCATQKYADAIKTVLMPHEKDHEKRYKKFNGSEVVVVNEETTDQGVTTEKIRLLIQDKWQKRMEATDTDALSIDPFLRTVDVSKCPAVTKAEEEEQKKAAEEKKKAAAKGS